MKLYLQDIVENNIALENLPAQWQNFNFGRFSSDKTLFDFQKQGLQNALKALFRFYIDEKGNKINFFNGYKIEENLDYDLKKKADGKTAQYLIDYEKDYPTTDGKISFAHFINRMSFWMATGSGKTLIIVKLIELLGTLMQRNEIPKNDILFLAHRDDLLEQFKKHVNEFNSFNFETKINLKSLKDYESVKRENSLPFAKNEITVFYYRSDLISDEQKEKIVNFRNYDNDGKWYILLDEAHKGDKEDSKRQVLYSILSRDGFLFNFSATFTDPRDYATCVFNFNLSKFIEEGYGKHIYVSQKDVEGFRDQTDFAPIEKQKIVLKTLILQTYINKYFEKVRKEDKTLYHRPLLLTLVNSVSKPDADLQLFFREIEKIAKEPINDKKFNNAKNELLEELKNNPKYEFEEEKFNLNESLFLELEYEDILEQVYNSKKPGSLEISFRPSDKSQVAFKLTTSDRHFALIKTGEMPQWLRDEMSRFNINQGYEDEKYFEEINNDDSEINILMGSRAFYEGWDSNRPNIILFVNIGVGSDAKKFVLQSVGRGVRIEPQKNKRKRLLNLYYAKEIKEELFNKIQKNILPLESLFVFGTNAENLREIIKTLKEEKQEKDLGYEFVINKDAEKRLLLIPVYKESDKIFAEEREPQKYGINRDDFDLAKAMFNYIGPKIALAKYECDVRVVEKASESFGTPDQYFDFEEVRTISEPGLLVDRILDYFSVRDKEFDKFKKLENEIVHFKRIKFSDGEKFEQIKKKIEEIKQYPEKQKELDKQYGKMPREEFARKQMSLFEAQNFEYKGKKLKIKYIQNHYYIPLIVSENEKVDYLNHIIDVPSEVTFIEQLEEYVQSESNVFKQFDWWMFSKLDQTIDEVHIPYYNPKENTMAKFKPDFIFWMQKGNEYVILFVDPKGTENTDGLRKIDGYSRIFENKKHPYNGLDISTKVLLKPAHGGVAGVPENYRKYWFDNFSDFATKLSN